MRNTPAVSVASVEIFLFIGVILLVVISGCTPQASVTEASLHETEPLYERNADTIRKRLGERGVPRPYPFLIDVPAEAREQAAAYLARIGAVVEAYGRARYILNITYTIGDKPPTDQGELATDIGNGYELVMFYKTMHYPNERLVVARATIVDRATNSVLSKSEGDARFDPDIERVKQQGLLLPGMSTITRDQAIALAARRALYTMH